MPLETVAQPEAAPTETSQTETATTSTADASADPFAVDESQFVSLTPEQRAALDPVLNKWKETAKSYAQKEREAEGKKYTDHVKKAAALEKLVADPRFVKWYQETNNPSNQPLRNRWRRRKNGRRRIRRYRRAIRCR